MESTFWVFLWLALRYGSHNVTDESSLISELNGIFNYTKIRDGLPVGGDMKQGIMLRPKAEEALPAKFIPYAVNQILWGMQETFHPRYLFPVKKDPLLDDEALSLDEETETLRTLSDKLYDSSIILHRLEMKRLDDPTYLRKVIKGKSAVDWSDDTGPVHRTFRRQYDPIIVSSASKRKYSDEAVLNSLAEPSAGAGPSQLAREGEDEDSDANETRTPSKRQRIMSDGDDDDVEAVEEVLMAQNGVDSEESSEVSCLPLTKPPSSGSSAAFSRPPSPLQDEMHHEGAEEGHGDDTIEL